MPRPPPSALAESAGLPARHCLPRCPETQAALWLPRHLKGWKASPLPVFSQPGSSLECINDDIAVVADIRLWYVPKEAMGIELSDRHGPHPQRACGQWSSAHQRHTPGGFPAEAGEWKRQSKLVESEQHGCDQLAAPKQSRAQHRVRGSCIRLTLQPQPQEPSCQHLL